MLGAQFGNLTIQQTLERLGLELRVAQPHQLPPQIIQAIRSRGHF
jgi:hypothetical protein